MSSHAEWHEQLSTAFLTARDLGTPAREAYLRELNDSDSEMAGWVERMLAAETKPSPLLGGSSCGPFLKFTAPDITGSRIGRYTVTRRIGAGGMGAVYEAVQDHPQRSVAIKILPVGPASRTAARRFEYESSVLARLQHPAIAQIYEAGVHHEDGLKLPFFAMEFVPDAVPITTYANAKKLSIRDIVELFIRVCDAVHHGHQRGVIHRDLKPENILVDATGRPKVIDFGVARAVDRELQAITLQTESGHLVGTVPYMSPEQVAGATADLDIRTDVYSLGVVLFELLTGSLPYDFAGKSFIESIDLIRNAAPLRAAVRSSAVPFDLELLLAKTLEKDRDCRYASVAELIADLKRYLNNEPITARPPSVGYQLRKFAARNKAMVAAAIMLFVVLLGGVVAERYRANQAINARDDAIAAQQVAYASQEQAKIEAARANRVIQFLNGMLSKVSPDEAQGETVTVEEVLDAVAADIDVDLQDAPEVEATVRYIIGKTYFDLGRYPQAVATLTTALDLHDELHLSNSETIAILKELGASQGKLEKPEVAISVFDRAIALAESDPSTSEELRLELLRGRAELLHALGRTNEAVAEYERVIELTSRLLGEESEATMFTKATFGMLLALIGQSEDAIEILNESLDWYGANKTEPSGKVMQFRQALAAAEAQAGHYDRAIQELSRLEADMRAHFGPNHPRMAEILNHSGGMLRQLGYRVEAEAKIREALAIQSQIFGENHIIVARTLGKLASTLINSDRLSESLELHRRAEGIYQAEGITDSDEYATHLHRYANTLRLANRCDEALSLERQSYEITRRIHGESHPQTTSVRSLLAAIEMTCGDPAIAADMLKTVLESDRQELPDNHPTIARSAMNLASASFRAGRMNAALLYSEEAVERFEQVGPSAVELLQKAMALRSLMLLVDGQTPEAISTAEAAIELSRNSDQSNPSQLLAISVQCAASLTIGDAQAAVVQLKKTTELLKSDVPQWPELAAIALTLQARWQLLEGNVYEAEQLREKALRVLDQHFSKDNVYSQWMVTFIAAPNRQLSGR